MCEHPVAPSAAHLPKAEPLDEPGQIGKADVADVAPRDAGQQAVGLMARTLFVSTDSPTRSSGRRRAVIRGIGCSGSPTVLGARSRRSHRVVGPIRHRLLDFLDCLVRSGTVGGAVGQIRNIGDPHLVLRTPRTLQCGKQPSSLFLQAQLSHCHDWCEGSRPTEDWMKTAVTSKSGRLTVPAEARDALILRPVLALRRKDAWAYTPEHRELLRPSPRRFPRGTGASAHRTGSARPGAVVGEFRPHKRMLTCSKP